MTQKTGELDAVVENKDLTKEVEGDGKTEPTEQKKAKPKPRGKSLRKQLEEAKTECQTLKDQLLRKAAEFDNYKKRTEKEFFKLMTTANAELITEILPIVDDLERCLRSAEENQDFDSLHKGVELIYKNLLKVLDRRGVKPIESVGQAFDPEKHEALMQIASDEHPSGTVVEEHLKGYFMNDRVLRHAKVIVSK